MRLVTRADMDGLCCAALLKTVLPIQSIHLCHPQDITDKKIEIGSDDVLANLPYHPDCGLWFDHHELTESNERPPDDVQGAFRLAPSAARVVFDHYQAKEFERYESMVEETDRLDSANLNLADIVNPQGWILVGYTLDSRTGLGAFRDYFLHLLDLVEAFPLDDLLEDDEVKLRVSRVLSENAAYQKLVERSSKLHGNVVVTDLRKEPPPYPAGNRFLIYTLYPECNVSLRLHWGTGKAFLVAAIRHNIFNRNCQTDIGQQCAKFGGGGHRGAGTTPIPVETADRDIAAIVSALRES